MYTASQTKELIRKAVERFPDRINPWQPTEYGGKNCLYTSHDGESHCIAGQIMVDVGLEAPPSSVLTGFWGLALNEDDGNDEFIPELAQTFDPEALGVLEEAQTVFDNAGGDPIPWSEALALCERDWEEADRDPQE